MTKKTLEYHAGLVKKRGETLGEIRSQIELTDNHLLIRDIEDQMENMSRNRNKVSVPMRRCYERVGKLLERSLKAMEVSRRSLGQVRRLLTKVQ